MRIIEIADQPYKTFSKGENMGSFKAKFIAKGSLIQVNITPYTRDKKIVDVGFFDATDDMNPTIDMTGKGDAFRIFATVGAIVKDYVAKNDPDVLTFSGKTRDPSRIRLYDLIAKNIGKYLPGYKLGDSGIDLGDKRYTFVRAGKDLSESLLTEGKNYPCIVVDVQPEYSGMNDGDESAVFPEIINFVNNQTGPVLMFVNAEDQGLTGDTVSSIKQYWEDTVRGEDYDYDDEDADTTAPINWNRFTIVDKGYGYFRAWMDVGMQPSAIIRTIRLMYQQKVNDSRELFGGEGSADYDEGMKQLLGDQWDLWPADDPLIVEWTSVAQLKRFNGAYIVGGGREECLREVELLMNAFNIKYRRIDSLVY